MGRGLIFGAAATLIAGGAVAAPIAVIDDFSSGDQFVNKADPSDDNGIRELRIYNIFLGPGSDMDPMAFVDTDAPGVFGINNGIGDDSTVDIFYDLVMVDADFIDVNFLNNDNALPTDSDLELFVAGISQGAQTLHDMNDPFTISFSLSDAAQMALRTGTSLMLTFNGSPAFDLSVDSITARIPEPGALGFLGLGLLGMSAVARRKAA